MYYDYGKYKIASDTLFSLLNLKDMFFSQEKIKAFADMEQKYESEKMNSTIKLLKSKNEIAALQAARNLAVIIGLGIALLGIVLIAYLFYSQSNKRKKLNTDLSIEKKKSDDLLLNILPPEVAEELKSKGSAEAKQFENVTVLFTDFENFTQISEQMSPIELVKTLNTFFEAFDNIITQLDIEKIKTIGDSYMCVGGLPVPSFTHAEDVVQAAIEMQQFVSQYAKEQEAQGKKPLLIRIGINSGPVIAGIVGNKKYAYDIWGDTVNTASRMENSGSVGKINISGSTYELIKQKFICIPRGKIAAKNKGQLDMYFVEGRI
jgi:adenylate cyclase